MNVLWHDYELNRKRKIEKFPKGETHEMSIVLNAHIPGGPIRSRSRSVSPVGDTSCDCKFRDIVACCVRSGGCVARQ